MVDVTFGRASVVGKENPPCEAIKQLAIGDIRSQEDKVTKVVVPQAACRCPAFLFIGQERAGIIDGRKEEN